MEPSHPVILFDGVCNFCNFWVKAILRLDRRAVFRFASLQSEAAQSLLGGIDTQRPLPDSILLLEQGRIYSRSTAVLRILNRLGGPWKIAYALIFIPRPVRDAVYGWIAANRYRIFGKRDACMIPTEDVKKRFLDM